MTEQSTAPSHQRIPKKPRLFWLKKWLRGLLAVLTSVVIIGLLGLWLVQSPDAVLNVSNVIQDYFWCLAAFRWLCYAVFLFEVWPRVAAWCGRRDGVTNAELTTSVLAWRRSFLRIFVMYELLFPFDAISLIGRYL